LNEFFTRVSFPVAASFLSCPDNSLRKLAGVVCTTARAAGRRAVRDLPRATCAPALSAVFPRRAHAPAPRLGSAWWHPVAAWRCWMATVSLGRFDPRRRRGPRLDADAVVDLQGPQADAPAPRRRSLLDRLEALRGALLPREQLLPRLSPRVRVRAAAFAAGAGAASPRRG